MNIPQGGSWSSLAGVAILCAVGAVNIRPGPSIISAVQHFADGVVFAAVAGEIMPDVAHSGSPVATIVGGFVGISVMLAIRQLERVSSRANRIANLGRHRSSHRRSSFWHCIRSGMTAGLLLTIALSVEVLFLGLAVTTELSETVRSRSRIVATVAALGVLMPVGAAISSPVAALQAHYVTGFLTFGLIALLYLVAEKLLVEAHETV